MASNLPVRAAPHVMPVRELAKRIVVLVEKGDGAREKADQYYRAAGIHLRELKERKPAGAAWIEYVKKKTGLGKSRANELIAIADGRTTLEETRASTAGRVRRHEHAKSKRPLANGRPDSDEPQEEYDEPTEEEALEAAFLMRAGEALRYAVYAGPATKKAIKWAGQTADAWAGLAKEIEGRARDAKAVPDGRRTISDSDLDDAAVARVSEHYKQATGSCLTRPFKMRVTYLLTDGGKPQKLPDGTNHMTVHSVTPANGKPWRAPRYCTG